MIKNPIPRPVKRLLSSFDDAKGQAVVSIEIEETDSWRGDFLVIRFVSGDAIALRGHHNDYFGDLERFDIEPFTPSTAYGDDRDALAYFGHAVESVK